MARNLLKIVLIMFIFLSCTKDKEEDTSPELIDRNGDWLVDFDEILYWGDPADEIRSIDDPQFIPVNQAEWSPDDRMFIYHAEGITKVYPVPVLEEHEIVNDQNDNKYFAVTYCPITGSGIAWDRVINGEVTEFGVSGMLFNENLVPYDRNTNSYWSQMLMLCIHGELIETIPEPVLLFETTFGFISEYFSDAIVLDPSPISTTSFYEREPVYKDNPLDPSPGSGSSQLLQSGTIYFGIMNNKRVQVFEPEQFEEGIKLHSSLFMGRKYLVVGEKGKFILSFDATEYAGRSFSVVTGAMPVIIMDDAGNKYDLFGKVVSGPDYGNYLKPGSGYLAKGFAWESIFDLIEIYDQ